MDFVVQTMNCVDISVIGNILADVLMQLFFIVIAKDLSLPTKHQDGTAKDDV